MNIATTAAPPEYREGPRKYARRRKSPWEQWFKDKRAGMGCQGKGQRLWLSLTSAFPQRLKPRPFKTNQTEPLRRRRLNDLESDWFGGAGAGRPRDCRRVAGATVLGATVGGAPIIWRYFH